MLWNKKAMQATTLGLGCAVGVMVLPLVSQKYRIQPFPSPDQIEKISAPPDLGRVEDGHDLMEKRSQELSGMDSTDCGAVGVRENPQLATKCALRSFSEGKPFRVRYDLMGIDSDVAEGIASSAGGQVYELSFDGDPAGHEGTSRARQRAGVRNCPTPVHLWVNSNGRLECFPPSGGSLTSHDGWANPAQATARGSMLRGLEN
jgi:hypothetical protein